MKIIITSPYDAKPEIQSEESMLNYFTKISQLTDAELCIEVSNVMAAKYNQRVLPSSFDDYQDRQKLISDLTDRAVMICIYKFGKSAVLGYADGDLRSFNELVNTIDEKIALLDLYPEEHGAMLLKSIERELNTTCSHF